MIQTWVCTLFCQAVERVTCALVGHPVVRVRPGMAWCARCGKVMRD